jgi:DNA end-binding protein Ku
MAAKEKPRVSSRPVWSGAISFGLVTIPVKLFVAVREKTLHFRSLHDQDRAPLKQKLVCSADGKEVHREHIVKGFEIEKDSYVVVRQEELDSVAPKATKTIDIQDFVALDEIDPVYFDRSYYVSPKSEGAKPYRLLLQGMTNSRKVAIARIVMHNKEYLAALRPHEADDADQPVLVMETMHFDDEVVSVDAVPDADRKGRIDERELKMAQQLIDSLTTEFKPGKYHDEYREKVMEMIERKAEGKNVVVRRESEPRAPKGHDLIAALEASLAKSKGGGSGTNGHHVMRGRRRRRSA